MPAHLVVILVLRLSSAFIMNVCSAINQGFAPYIAYIVPIEVIASSIIMRVSSDFLGVHISQCLVHVERKMLPGINIITAFV
ncbi:hypothetical protein EDC94DRAFT_617785 [Helicostylum pulchrum]|nr:hypothetical protein EDC94DRAFT_617785 [Helicostylum pulchrum]